MAVSPLGIPRGGDFCKGATRLGVTSKASAVVLVANPVQAAPDGGKLTDLPPPGATGNDGIFANGRHRDICDASRGDGVGVLLPSERARSTTGRETNGFFHGIFAAM